MTTITLTEYRVSERVVLRPGDRFRVTAGPYWRGQDGTRIPMAERFVGHTLPADGRYLLVCARGQRSRSTCEALRERGLRDAWSLRGGAQRLAARA